MDPRQVNTAAEARQIVEERGLQHIKVGVFDVDGVMRGKYMSREKFFSALDKGFGFCDVVLGWDSNDQLYENPGVEYTGWHTGYPDAPVRILPGSCRNLQYEPRMLLFLAEFAEGAEALCPRGLLRRVLERAAGAGFSVKASFEYEFFLFNETPDSVRAKGFADLQPATPGFFGYSMLRNSVHAEWYTELLEMCEAMDFPLEGLHTETGPGVLEAAIAVDDALNAADKAALFKTFSKVWAQRNDMMATFMAKWSNDYPGQSGHIHMSLFDRDSGQSVFHDPSQDRNMSLRQRQFLAGQQQLMPETAGDACPDRKRLQPPGARLLGAYRRHLGRGENRTTALRVIPGGENSQRVEYRLGSADANPYIALAAALGAGLWGIEQQLDPEEQVRGNAYDQQHPPHLALPGSLTEAAGMLRGSEVAVELFGSAFVEHYATTREWEDREFRKHITDWELQRYFEII